MRREQAAHERLRFPGLGPGQGLAGRELQQGLPVDCLVRVARERQKPNEERLREYGIDIGTVKAVTGAEPPN